MTSDQQNKLNELLVKEDVGVAQANIISTSLSHIESESVDEVLHVFESNAETFKEYIECLKKKYEAVSSNDAGLLKESVKRELELLGVLE